MPMPLQMKNDHEGRVPATPVVAVQTSEIPRWVRLLFAPAGFLLLGIAISPKFLVLALVYFLTAVGPLYACWSLNCVHINKDDYPQHLGARLDETLALHRSMTVQFAMLGACLFFYEYTRTLCSPKNTQQGEIHMDNNSTLVVHRAFEMARRIVHFEHLVGLPIEPKLQTFVWNHCRFVIYVANFYYATFNFVAPVGVMARLIITLKDPRYEYRVGFFVTLFIALLFFAFVPTMPPRLLGGYKMEYMDSVDDADQQVIQLSEHDAQILEPYWNIIDTMKQGQTLYDKLHEEGGNPYAALPSMHTGWALWSCLTYIETIDSENTSAQSRLWQTILAIAHVAFMVFTIFVTGNHFWVDSAAGAACVLMGRVLADKLINKLLCCPPGKNQGLLFGPSISSSAAGVCLFSNWYRPISYERCLPLHQEPDGVVAFLS